MSPKLEMTVHVYPSEQFAGTFQIKERLERSLWEKIKADAVYYKYSEVEEMEEDGVMYVICGWNYSIKTVNSSLKNFDQVIIVDSLTNLSITLNPNLDIIEQLNTLNNLTKKALAEKALAEKGAKEQEKAKQKAVIDANNTKHERRKAALKGKVFLGRPLSVHHHAPMYISSPTWQSPWVWGEELQIYVTNFGGYKLYATEMGIHGVNYCDPELINILINQELLYYVQEFGDALTALKLLYHYDYERNSSQPVKDLMFLLAETIGEQKLIEMAKSEEIMLDTEYSPSIARVVCDKYGISYTPLKRVKHDSFAKLDGEYFSHCYAKSIRQEKSANNLTYLDGQFANYLFTTTRGDFYASDKPDGQGAWKLNDVAPCFLP